MKEIIEDMGRIERVLYSECCLRRYMDSRLDRGKGKEWLQISEVR